VTEIEIESLIVECECDSLGIEESAGVASELCVVVDDVATGADAEGTDSDDMFKFALT
jgi:hypothetical protein